ncbi:hypothetical protein PR048_002017 [Dryococelus australis]|uniref:C2H2-type domain-containing protein n=1 Tax=Dryococelus australis TaxID=614101 RepID=A0ABQ9IIZ2_9NEOP|nr:hypothetical protein PR048_002017 [Dryococelus australis]
MLPRGLLGKSCTALLPEEHPVNIYFQMPVTVAMSSSNAEDTGDNILQLIRMILARGATSSNGMNPLQPVISHPSSNLYQPPEYSVFSHSHHFPPPPHTHTLSNDFENSDIEEVTVAEYAPFMSEYVNKYSEQNWGYRRVSFRDAYVCSKRCDGAWHSLVATVPSNPCPQELKMVTMGEDLPSITPSAMVSEDFLEVLHKQCCYCGNTFSQSFNVRYQECIYSLFSPTYKAVHCDNSDSVYANKCALTAHNTICSIKFNSAYQSFHCDKCDIVFSRSDNIYRHKKSKGIVCRSTGRECKYSSKMIAFRFSARQPEENNFPFDINYMTYTCVNCNVVYASREALSVSCRKSSMNLDYYLLAVVSLVVLIVDK